MSAQSNIIDQLIERTGGRFRLTVLIQKRIQELARGAQPLVDVPEGRSLIDIALAEIHQGKVGFESGDEEGKPRKSRKEKEKDKE